MADKTVTVKLNADTHGFTAAMARAATASKQLGSQVKAHGGDLDRMASMSTKAGLAVTAGVGGAVKAAVDWESAWTGVQKTVDASPAQYARLEGQLRSLTSVLPVSHQEIAGVAEAAGQLGVKQQDITKFTSTMVKLGTATNMTSEEAATSLRQFMNVMGTAPGDVDRLASTVVDLGNNSATTERDIVEMGQRLSGTGKQMNITESQVMAFGAAMASVGINAEAGGTAMSRNWVTIDRAVRQGGSSLKAMAKVSGMSAAQFKKAWQTDAAGATNALIEGLGRAGKAGKDVSGLLGEMGINGQYQTDAMKRLAGASAGAGNAQDQLASSLKTAGEGWSQNTALAQEFGRRQSTTASQMQLAVNRIKDAAISLGQAALPVLGRAAQKVSEYADKFNGLSDHTKDMILQIGAFGGGSLIAAGQIGKVARAVKDVGLAFKAVRGVSSITGSAQLVSGTGVAMEGMGTKALGATGKVSGLAVAGRGLASAFGGLPGIIATATGALLAYGKVADWQHADEMTKQMGTAKQWASSLSAGMMDLDGTMRKVNDGGFGPLRQNLAGLGDALSNATGVGLNGFEKALDGFGDAIGSKSNLGAEAKTEMAKVDTALSLLAQSHNWAVITANWQQIADAAKAQNIPVSTLMTLFPQVQKTLGGVARQLDVTGLSAQDYAAWMGGKIPTAVNRAALANSKLAKSLGIIPTQTRKEVSVEVKGGSKKQIAELNKEILKVPANRQSQVALTAKTKGFAPAMAEAKAFEKQAAGLQAVTSKGITLEVKNGTKGQAAQLADQIKGFTKGAQAEVAVTAKTKGFDAAAAQVRQFKKQVTGSKLNVKGDIYISVHGATQQEVNALRDDISSLPRSTQLSIATTANTKGLDAARAQLNQYLAATQGQHTVSMTMSVVDNGAVKIIKDVQVATRNINGVEVKIPVSDPGAVGALTALEGVNYRVRSLGGAKVLVPTSAPGAALAGQQIKMVTGKWHAINGKQIAISTSAPGAVGTKAQIDGVHGSWQRIHGKVVFVATKAPGATTAKSQVDQLNSAAARTNGKHIQITATANTSAARSKIQSLTGVQGHATIIVNTVTGKTPRWMTSHIASANAHGNLYERHDAQIARAGSWRVWAEPETGGEAYIPLAASKRGRSRMIAAATVQKLGGDVQWFANGSSLTGAQSRAVQAKIVITADATASLRSTSEAAASALRNLRTVTRQTAPALKSTNSAYAAYAKANARANQLRDQKARYDAQMNVQISRASKSRAKALRATKARTDARSAQQITAAKQRAAALKKVYDTRAKASKAASDKLKAAQDKLTEANKSAADAQKELADSAAQAGKSLSDSFRGGGSVTDWVSSMSEGVATLTAFNSRLQQLRKLGLSQANIDTLTGMGAAQGSEMAAEILKGGKASVNALNRASNSLDAIAKKLGLSTVARYANGGLVASQATISATALFAEAGPEAFIPLATAKRSRAVPIWWETGRRLGITTHANGSISPHGATTGGGTAVVAAPVVQIDRLVLDVPGIGTAIDARVKSIQTSTARNIRRAR